MGWHNSLDLTIVNLRDTDVIIGISILWIITVTDEFVYVRCCGVAEDLVVEGGEVD